MMRRLKLLCGYGVRDPNRTVPILAVAGTILIWPASNSTGA
jgi:hypothetical protein